VGERIPNKCCKCGRSHEDDGLSLVSCQGCSNLACLRCMLRNPDGPLKVDMLCSEECEEVLRVERGLRGY
jgi:hypothetical protein